MVPAEGLGWETINYGMNVDGIGEGGDKRGAAWMDAWSMKHG